MNARARTASAVVVDPDDFADEVFDAAVGRLARGERVGPEDFAAATPELEEACLRALRLAAEVAVRGPAVWPEVPGFTVLGELGRGGMGTVYLARQERLGGRLVALKVAPALAVHEPRTRARFLREARAMARVRHANVVQIHDVFDAPAVIAYALEWIDGPSLADVIRLRARAPEVAARELAAQLEPAVAREVLGNPQAFFVRVARDVARALVAVHAAGVLHRDVKPSNVLLRRNGTALLVDFGLAAEGDETPLTRSGTFHGTAAYAAPEQLRGARRGLDGRADVFGLGATLLHALTGAPRFEGSPSAVLERLEAAGPLDPRRVGDDLPRDLATVVARALEPEPASRYATAAEFADDLERLLTLRPIRARARSPWTRARWWLRRHRRGVGAAAAGGLAMLGLGASISGLSRWAERGAERELATARSLLLHPGITESLYLVVNRGTGLDAAGSSVAFDGEGELVERYDAALAAYDRATRYAPFARALAAERDALRLARDVWTGVHAPVGRPELERYRSFATARVQGDEAWSGVVGLPPQDARVVGFLAYLLGDIDTCVAAWANLEQDDDPLRAAIRGLIELGWRRPASAYAHLRDARAGLPNNAAVHTYLADCALQLGRLDECARLVDRARSLGRADAFQRIEVVEADLAAARGDARLALQRYGRHLARHQSRRAALHAAALHASLGEFESAVLRLAQLLERRDGCWYAPEAAALLGGYWARAPERERRALLLSAARDPLGTGERLALVLDALGRHADRDPREAPYGTWRIPKDFLDSWSIAIPAQLATSPRWRPPAFGGLHATREMVRTMQMTTWMPESARHALMNVAYRVDRELDGLAGVEPRWTGRLVRVAGEAVRGVLQRPMRWGTALALAVLAGSSSGQFTLDFEFDQDGVLPSSHSLFLFTSNAGVSESSLYDVVNGLLEQRTINASGNALYYAGSFQGFPATALVLDSGRDTTIETRLRVLNIDRQWGGLLPGVRWRVPLSGELPARRVFGRHAVGEQRAHPGQ